MNVTTIGIDLAKHTFSLHGVELTGAALFAASELSALLGARRRPTLASAVTEFFLCRITWFSPFDKHEATLPVRTGQTQQRRPRDLNGDEMLVRS